MCVCLCGVFISIHVNICKLVCEYRGHLQLPNFSGQAWASIGKSSRCMGHSALTVSLERFTHTWTENEKNKHISKENQEKQSMRHSQKDW